MGDHAQPRVRLLDPDIPGLHHLEVPLPGHSIGHVNVYAFESDDGLLLVDCGWGTAETRDHLGFLLNSIGHSWRDVRMLVATHLHPDHCGLAGWLQRSGASFAMHAADVSQLVSRQAAVEILRDGTQQWLEWTGAPSDVWGGIHRRAFDERSRISSSQPDVILTDATTVEHGAFALKVLHTPGHTAGSISLFESSTGTLLTGDTLFARSTYSPSFRALDQGNPMEEYMVSLRRLGELPASRVLPGHNQSFIGLGERLDLVAGHHARRAEVIAQTCRNEALTVWEVAAALPRTMPWSSLSLFRQQSAASEVCAHLIRLRDLGIVEEQGGRPALWRA